MKGCDFLVVPNYRFIAFLLGFILIVFVMGNDCYALEDPDNPLNSSYQHWCHSIDFVSKVFSTTVDTVIDTVAVPLNKIHEYYVDWFNLKYPDEDISNFVGSGFIDGWFNDQIIYNETTEVYNCSSEFIEAEQFVIEKLQEDHGYVIGYTDQCRYRIASFPSANKYLSWSNTIGGNIGIFPINVTQNNINNYFVINPTVDIVFIRSVVNDSGVYAFRFYDAETGSELSTFDKYIWNNESQVYEKDTNYATLTNSIYYLKRSPSSFVNNSWLHRLIYSSGYRSFYIFSSYQDYLLFTDGRMPVMRGDNIRDSFNTTQLDNSVTYGDVINHFGNETTITADQVADYINNYNDNVTNNNGNGSGDNNGGNGGSSILDALSGFIDFIGRIIGILVNGITNLLESLVGTFESIVNFIPSIFNNYLSTLFGWLPEPIIGLITLSISLGVILFIIKFIRG